MTGAATLRTIVVDDEPLARQILREYLSDQPGVEVVAECANGFDAVRCVGELSPDLVFLDIQMPKLDGFDVLELIGDSAAVIFVTAFDQHALRAFEIHALDYLLKPVSRERLTDALDHARARIGKPAPVSAARLAAEARPDREPATRILIKDQSRVHVIPIEAVEYVEAQDDYVCIHAEGKRYLKTQTLAEVESALDPRRFVRIHRSYLLNVDRLARLEPYAKDSRVAVLADGRQLPVSRSGYTRLKELL